MDNDIIVYAVRKTVKQGEMLSTKQKPYSYLLAAARTEIRRSSKCSAQQKKRQCNNQQTNFTPQLGGLPLQIPLRLPRRQVSQHVPDRHRGRPSWHVSSPHVRRVRRANAAEPILTQVGRFSRTLKPIKGFQSVSHVEGCPRH